MAQTGFAARMARHLDGPVEAACAVRPPHTTTVMALIAGLGAAIGSVVGGSAIAAGIGGGAGALVGTLVNWLRLLPSDLTLSMALVLGPDRLELLRLNAFATRPLGTIRTIPYADLTGVETRNVLFEQALTLRTRDEELGLMGGRRGVGALPPVVDELRRRLGRGSEAR